MFRGHHEEGSDITNDPRNNWRRATYENCIFLENVDDKMYGQFSRRFQERKNLYRDEYPKSMADIYELMAKHAAINVSRNHNNNNNNNNNHRNDRRNQDEIMFIRRGPSSNDNNQELVPDTDENAIDVLCFNCNQHVHMSYNCPSRSNSDARGGNIRGPYVVMI